jgi:hypothetical protein
MSGFWISELLGCDKAVSWLCENIYLEGDVYRGLEESVVKPCGLCAYSVSPVLMCLVGPAYLSCSAALLEEYFSMNK